jgi:hypothetical protein
MIEHWRSKDINQHSTASIQPGEVEDERREIPRGLKAPRHDAGDSLRMTPKWLWASCRGGLGMMPGWVRSDAGGGGLAVGPESGRGGLRIVLAEAKALIGNR